MEIIAENPGVIVNNTQPELVITDDISDDLAEDLLNDGPRQINIRVKGYTAVPDSVPYKPQDFDYGPNTYANRYSTLRRYHFVGYDDRNIVVWQDLNNFKGYITEFFEWDTKTSEFEITEGHVLGSAIKGEDGEIFYFTIEEGEPADKFSTREAFLYKIDYEGNIKKKAPLDTTKENGINIYGMHTSCQLAYNSQIDNPRLSIHMARTMTQAYDGLNHQGGFFSMFNSDTLELYHDTCWETASHSMGNALKATGGYSFVGLEIGDNYPRGISMFH